jgi:hypothetical protein
MACVGQAFQPDKRRGRIGEYVVAGASNVLGPKVIARARPACQAGKPDLVRL